MYRVLAAGCAFACCFAALSAQAAPNSPKNAGGDGAGSATRFETLRDGTPIRADDAQRLASLEASYGQALRQALNEANDETVFAIIASLRGQPRPVADGDMAELVGEWKCNMTKIGGISPGVIYPPYRCEIRAEGDALVFEKQTGSQLTRGTLHRDGDRIVYLGTDYIRGSTPPAYAELPAEINPKSPEQFFPDAGILEVTGPKQARIVLPQPYVESELNVLQLAR